MKHPENCLITNSKAQLPTTNNLKCWNATVSAERPVVAGPGGEINSSKEGKSNPYKFVSEFRIFWMCQQKKQGHVHSVPSIEKTWPTNGRCWIFYFDLQGSCIPKMPSLRVIFCSFFKRPKEALPEQLLGTSFCWRKKRNKIEKIHATWNQAPTAQGWGCVGKQTRD